MRQGKIPRAIVILGLGAFINAVGNSLVWPLNSLFMHNVLGKSLTQAGLIIALQSGLSLAGQFVSGFIADRIGAKRLMVLGLLLASFTVGLIGLFPVWPVYAPGIVFLGLTQALIFVPLNALISIIWPEGERRGFNYLYVAVNAGVAIGTALGAVVAQVSFRLVFFSNAVTYLCYLIVVLWALPKQGYRLKPAGENTIPCPFLHADGFKPLIVLSGGIFLVWSAYIQLTTTLPVVMSQRGFPLTSYSILWTLNGVFIVTLQPVTSWLIRVWAHSFQRQFLVACTLIGSAFLLLLGPIPYTGYLVTMLVLTLGEMLILPTVPTVAAQLAPQGKEGAFQGIVAGMASGGRMLGPMAGGFVFDHFGGTMVWALALGFICAAMAFFLCYGSLAKDLAAENTGENINLV